MFFFILGSLKLTREIFAQQAFDPYRGAELSPGPAVATDAEIDAHIRRLRQKLEIITEESAASVNPTEADLQNYLAAHAEQFRGETRLAFEQIYFDAAKRGAGLARDIHKRVIRVIASWPRT